MERSRRREHEGNWNNNNNNNNGSRFKLVVLPWILFLSAVIIYLMIITLGLLSQLLRVTLPQYYSHDLSQGQTATYDFQEQLYYFKVEVNTVRQGQLLLGFLENESGQYLLNRTLSSGLENENFETGVIIPLHQCELFSTKSSSYFQVYVLLSPHVEKSETSACSPFNSQAQVLTQQEVVRIAVYTSIPKIPAKFKSIGAVFFFSLTLTSFLYLALLWLRRSFRGTVVIYVIMAIILIASIVSTFSSSFKLGGLIITYVLSLLPLFHLFILFFIARISMRAEDNNTNHGASLMQIVFAGQPRVFPVSRSTTLLTNMRMMTNSSSSLANRRLASQATIFIHQDSSKSLTQSAITRSEICKYYCPICMLYHDMIHKTVCCSQYVCQSCVNDFVLLKADKQSIDCPYCALPGVKFVAVSPNEEVRNYEDSPKVSARSTTSNSNKNPLKRSISSTSSTRSLSSPPSLEAMEKLRARMISFDRPSRMSSGTLPPLNLSPEIQRNNSTDMLIHPHHAPLRAVSRHISLPSLLHQALQNSILQGTDSYNNNNNSNNTNSNINNNVSQSNLLEVPNTTTVTSIVREISTSSITSSHVDSEDGETSTSTGSETLN